MNPSEKTKNRSDRLLLAGLVALVSWLDYLWASAETRPPHWDMARHLWTSLLYLDLLHFKTFYRLWTNYYYYPPLRYWSTLPFYLLFGTSMTVAIMSNVVFTAILTFSVYGIGKVLRNRATGLISAVFILCLPMFSSQFKEYQLDAQLCSMVALALYLLIKTNEFSDRRYSLWFGLSYGLGMLTKWTFFHAMVFPLGYALWKAFAARKEDFRKLHNVKWSALIAFGVSSLWYANHPRMLYNDLSSWAYKGPPWYSPESLFWYANQLESVQCYLVPVLLLVIGIGWAFLRRDRANTYLLLCFWGCYMVFTLTVHKDVRYSMPILVSASVLAVQWIGAVPSRAARILLMAFVTAYSAVAFWETSFGLPGLPQEVKLGHFTLIKQKGYSTAAPPTHEQWHLEDIFKRLAFYPEGQRVLQYRILDTMWFNSWGITYYALKYGVQLEKDGGEAPFILERTEKPLKKIPGYGIVESYELPDGSMAALLQQDLAGRPSP